MAEIITSSPSWSPSGDKRREDKPICVGKSTNLCMSQDLFNLSIVAAGIVIVLLFIGLSYFISKQRRRRRQRGDYSRKFCGCFDCDDDRIGEDEADISTVNLLNNSPEDRDVESGEEGGGGEQPRRVLRSVSVSSAAAVANALREQEEHIERRQQFLRQQQEQNPSAQPQPQPQPEGRKEEESRKSVAFSPTKADSPVAPRNEDITRTSTPDRSNNEASVSGVQGGGASTSASAAAASITPTNQSSSSQNKSGAGRTTPAKFFRDLFTPLRKSPTKSSHNRSTNSVGPEGDKSGGGGGEPSSVLSDDNTFNESE